ncbi:hypothetical protein Curi_c14230 [Gottschalkia acidurici 9a]|uniref:Uncharacterized protein n=1 Tax=Gottschalkia acidurici (strain ATCC 7906 / DSM 604 / BCRC 14475 / CIP 104303 / KCTC 5404 / NCIMB 10678 / 9a) TaxID=1128398 RepID=K0AXB0_GOTA9|nr:hypothetical protein [Gottschalkia acidurici]AFS78433.1 hypothetical protein Curi_c14230 [Gottschalkia acidurici 9a]
MKKLIKEWKYRLKNIDENLQIHIKAIENKEYTKDMRDYARSRVISLTEYKNLIESTIEALEKVKEEV